MWLIAFGSPIHKRSSWVHERIVLAKTQTGVGLIAGEAYPERTLPTNDVPELLEEPLLDSPDFFGHEIPLVSLNLFNR